MPDQFDRVLRFQPGWVQGKVSYLFFRSLSWRSRWASRSASVFGGTILHLVAHCSYLHLAAISRERKRGWWSLLIFRCWNKEKGESLPNSFRRRIHVMFRQQT